MKFINYLEQISGVDIYALTAFMIFFVFFIVMALWALKADKKLINHLSNLPFQQDQENPSTESEKAISL
jgi:cbb3-type cytochrome oxidase subunit 3